MKDTYFYLPIEKQNRLVQLCTEEASTGKLFEWGGMFATTYWADPKEKMVALLYRNMYPTRYGSLSDYFKILVYQSIID